MAGRKKESYERGRVEFKADPSWIERMTKEGERLGLSLSGFIRMVMTQYMDHTNTERNSSRQAR